MAYIDRELMFKKIKEKAMTKFDWSEQIDIDDFEKVIKELPVADVEEVRHGEWVYDGDCFHCSACNRTYQLGSLQTIYDVKRCWKYCANCSAKMNRDMTNE